MRVSQQSNLQESFSFMHGGPVRELHPPFDPRQLARFAAQGLYFGTCSWKYRGWEGMIYQGGYTSEAQFQRNSLREYTSYLPTVGVDFTYFAWPLPDMMSYLAESTPENFRLCPKVTKRITVDVFPDLPAYGRWAGQPNPDYLNPDLFRENFLQPLQRLKDRVGVVIFEFSGPAEADLERLAAFFRAVPREHAYAVEIRNPELVRPDFYALLRQLGVSPAFSHWTKMPPITQQWQAYLDAGGGEGTGPMVALSLVRPGRSFEEAVRLFQPYREMKDIYEEGRDELAAIGNFAMQKQRRAYILVGNRIEGCAPFTIGGIAQRIGAGRM